MTDISRIIVIGASMGGLSVLTQLVEKPPEKLPVAVISVAPSA